MITLNPEGLRSLIWRTAKLWAPPPRLSISEWAEAHAYLSREGNAESGKFHIDRMPYQRAMLDDPLDPEVRETAWMIASQLGKTLCIVIITEYFIDQQPSSILIVYPTLDSAKAWVREKFNPAIAETPKLRGKIKDPRARDSENTTLNKRFPGGNITISGANSPSTLRQRSKRVVIQDEIDGFEPNQEGDPEAQADKRAETFRNAVKLKSSTPTIKGLSRIENKFEASDKQYWFCPCPSCGHRQSLKWKQVKWPEGKPEEAWYECEACCAHLTDADRIEMILAGGWEATAPFRGIRGRHMNGLYRLIGKKDAYVNYLHEFVEGFLEAKRKGRFALMVWVNTFLAETWEEQTERLQSSDYLKRREDYGPVLPAEVIVLTCGVDVQGDRLELEVKGWNDAEESWGVVYRTLPGNPLRPEVWVELDRFLELSRWKTADGRELRIVATGIDTGAFTDEVYKFCKPRFSRRVYAVKGSNQPGDPLVGGRSHHNRRRCPVYRVGTDTAKHIIYGRLKMDHAGAGYMHFPKADGLGFDERYFQMLTAEEISVRYVKGFPRRVWVLPEGRRNEALDINVYALAALGILNPDWQVLRKTIAKDAPESKINKTAGTDAQTAPKEESQQVGQNLSNPTPPWPRRRPGGWVKGWRH